jgi:hypothetical protein
LVRIDSGSISAGLIAHSPFAVPGCWRRARYPALIAQIWRTDDETGSNADYLIHVFANSPSDLACPFRVPQPTSILACLGRRQRGWRHHHLLATSHTACACAYDLASAVFRHDVAPAFRTGVSGDCRSEVILRTDIGADHVMKHRKQFQCGGAAGRAHRLIRFNLHLVALRTTSVDSCSIKPEEPNQRVGDARGKLGVVHANVDCSIQRRR